jgi:hypothetical protein
MDNFRMSISQLPPLCYEAVKQATDREKGMKEFNVMPFLVALRTNTLA